MPHQAASHLRMPYNKELCKQEINTFLQMGLIRPPKLRGQVQHSMRTNTQNEYEKRKD